MSRRSRTLLLAGILIGVLLVVAGRLWWEQRSVQSRVRRTVLTTVQEETPSSFLVTGTMDLHATVRIDSSQYATPEWVTYMLSQTQPALLSLLQGSAQTEVKVPGRVSYGFDVTTLTADMIRVEDSNVVAVDLPALDIHSIEPSLSQLEVHSKTEGWMQVFESGVPEAVRQRALDGVREAFREQARARLDSATQPRVNTARALRTMLTPSLTAAGFDNPRFRIRVGDRLSLTPQATERENFQN